jgi:hypothetical protein
MVDATMLYAIKLGPMEIEDGPVSAYVGFTETGALQPVLALKDSDGLARLAAQVQGHELRCELTLLARGQTARIRDGAAAGVGALRASHLGLRSFGPRPRRQSRNRRVFPGERGGLLSRRALALLD